MHRLIEAKTNIYLRATNVTEQQSFLSNSQQFVEETAINLDNLEDKFLKIFETSQQVQQNFNGFRSLIIIKNFIKYIEDINYETSYCNQDIRTGC